MKKIYTFTLLKPAGNDTALVKGIPNSLLKKKINDAIMQRYPTVEQVGFYEQKQQNSAVLEMAGGEFCGNATRSLAYLLLGGNIGQITLQVSGTKKILCAGSTSENSAFADMPIRNDLECIRALNAEEVLVEIDGIVHLLCPRKLDVPTECIKEEGKRKMQQNNLLQSYPAAGIMFLSEDIDAIRMDPVIWVRDIQTIFYESACASGTTAVGLWKSLSKSTNISSFPIRQPSGMRLEVTIQKNISQFLNARISGPVMAFGKGKISI